ncbi:uncharacterized protein LOC110109689 [Dendrobium catenatum]|uniref:uncharacterized protein LOC110109689 n=1 Tax=Dendrobium catenatum TaxID=906689 RepID=UPI0009F5625F|nr:uncharacterized protein LOC110109689 [Dendrobium catenatum]
MSSLDRNDINLIIGNEWDYFHHPAIGILGGILVMWKKDLASFEVIEHSSQLIMGTLNINVLGKWNIATVYGGKDAQTHRSLWQKLEGCMIGDEPGIIGGDFNYILSKEDKKGGKRFHFSNGSKDMKKFSMNNDFHDIGNARFSFIVNGRTSKWIIAENGFRQGCPLSPYLYIICSHLFSLAMAQRGQDLGIQVSHRAQKVSHLLFADDVLLLCQASKHLAVKLNNIVLDFCSWTGLKVNNAKSQILFNKGMNRVDILQVKKILKFKMLNTWGSKCLSLAGKDTLAKTSLLILPNFISTHTLVLKKVLHEVDKCCRKFIWHKRNGKKGMHYITLKNLCKSKAQEGLNFHSAVSRSSPLKARLTWRLIQNQNSLLHQVLITKYGDNLWKAKCRNGSSIAWNILNEGAEYLKPLLRWRVVNGRKIDVLNDIWLLDKQLNDWPVTADYAGLEGLNLSHFISENGCWDLEELQCFFHEDIITMVL